MRALAMSKPLIEYIITLPRSFAFPQACMPNQAEGGAASQACRAGPVTALTALPPSAARSTQRESIKQQQQQQQLELEDKLEQGDQQATKQGLLNVSPAFVFVLLSHVSW